MGVEAGLPAGGHHRQLGVYSWSCDLRDKPPWPNGQGVGLLIRRLWARVPQGVLHVSCYFSRDVHPHVGVVLQKFV